VYNLSEQQIEYILNDIRRNGVEMEDLQLNLLDHICCIIEQNLKEGDDFEDFYRKTVKQFCKHELWEIEEETIILLTIKNYYVMKKSMIISGIFSAITLVCGSFFKIMHWPGSAVLLVLGIVTLSFIFLPLTFLLKAKEPTTTQSKAVIGVGTLLGILLCISTLFKVMHWPGGNVLWFVTIGCSIFLFIPLYFFTGIRNLEAKINTIVTTIILIGATGMLFTLTSMRPGRAMERGNFFSNQDLVATRNYATEQNNLRYKMLVNDSSSAKKEVNELRKRSNNLYKKIEEIKLAIINGIEERNDTAIDYTNILNYNDAANYDVPGYLLFNNLGQPSPLMVSLKNEVDLFNSFIKTSYNKNSFGMLNTQGTKDVNGDGHMISWGEFNFQEPPFGIVIRNFTQIQLDVRVVEANCLH
jgi:hypothetical protein